MNEIILPFSKGGELWFDDSGQRGIQIKKEIFDWLVEQQFSVGRSFLSHKKFGFPNKIKFTFQDANQALLFKLTWGGE